MPVPSRVNIVTLGVRDLAAATAFYERLGWEASPASQPSITFLRTGGAVVALYGWDDLAVDARLPAGSAGDRLESFGGTTLAINVSTPDEVAACLDAAEAAGARLLKPAEQADWGGVSGYFADPDGHAWEVAWNPFFPLADDGTIQLP